MDEELLKKWNPWWVLGRVPKEKSGIIRAGLLGELSSFEKPREIVAVSGVRRSGKSTLLYQLIDRLVSEGKEPENILYFNFDEPLVGPASTETLERIYSAFIELNNPKGRKYVFFDEIQNVREWERWVKTNYDLKGKEVKFFVTGSNSSMLSFRLSGLLTGRMLPKEIFPLSFSEFLSFHGFSISDIALQKDELNHHLSKYLERGGFAEAVLENEEETNRMRLREYFNSILFRDIVAAREIKESAKLAELSQFAATNLCGIFSYNRISEAIGLNINTLKEYLHYLEQAYLVFQLNHFSYSLKETLAVQKPKKIHFIDNGMRNTVAARFSQDVGKLAENSVFLELKRREEEIYFWKGKHEVDFVVKRGAELEALNVTYGERIAKRETDGLFEFKEAFDGAKLTLITKNEENKEDGISCIPLRRWLLEKP